MENRDNGSARNQLDQDYLDTLTALEPQVRAAVEFAEQWDELYRPNIFEAALIRLSRDASAPEASPFPRPTSHTPEVEVSDDNNIPMSKLARAVEVDLDLLRRVIQIDEDGVIEIIGRLENDSDSVKEQQNKYSVVYAFVKEKAFNDQSVGIEDLRGLCKKHGCYDTANFTQNFRKDVRLRERKGEGRDKQYVATRQGLTEATELIRQMAED